jgi:rod shape-determining protein MreC
MKKDLAVLVPAGVVGRIVFATAHTARVLLASDPSSGIDAFVQRTRERGIVVGTGNGRARLKYVPEGADIRVGDVLLASGLGGIFPKGHPLGSVFRIGTKGGEMFEDVEVRLNVEFAKLEEVLVTTGGPRYVHQ